MARKEEVKSNDRNEEEVKDNSTAQENSTIQDNNRINKPAKVK